MKRYGLVGKHLTHSFSSEYFGKKFIELNLKGYEYINFPLQSPEEVRTLVQNDPDLCGLNVTIPYKETIIPFLNELDPEAAAIGAVNTIKITGSNSNIYLKGYNTDAYGFRMSVKPFLTNLHHRALILGSGGASRAVCHVLRQLGIDLLIVSRTPKNGEISWNELNGAIIRHFPLIVNTTPLGMFPDTNTCPDIPYSEIGTDHLLVDLIYNPSETLFLIKGKEKGAAVLNGLSMLHLQADRAWEIWQG